MAGSLRPPVLRCPRRCPLTDRAVPIHRSKGRCRHVLALWSITPTRRRRRSRGERLGQWAQRSVWRRKRWARWQGRSSRRSRGPRRQRRASRWLGCRWERATAVRTVVGAGTGWIRVGPDPGRSLRSHRRHGRWRRSTVGRAAGGVERRSAGDGRGRREQSARSRSGARPWWRRSTRPCAGRCRHERRAPQRPLGRARGRRPSGRCADPRARWRVRPTSLLGGRA
jgi:hypothetical protein